MSEEYNVKPFSVEMTFAAVDPEVLGILTGGALGAPTPPTFSIEVTSPIKRTFWQWLTRKPRRYQTIYIPNARLTGGREVSG